MTLRDWLPPTFGFAIATSTAAVLGMVATQRSVDTSWYDALAKPPFQPPRRVFGPTWTVLYVGIAMSGVRVWRARRSPARTRALVLWGTQLALNAAWSALFFGAKKPTYALVEIGALLGAIALYASYARKLDKIAAWLVVPYLAWTSFATVLNQEIVRRNPAVVGNHPINAPAARI